MKKSRLLSTVHACLGLFLGLSIGTAHAALINFTLVGTVGMADSGNGFGLGLGDSITTTGVFNDSALTGVGAENVVFSPASGFSLEIVVGSMNFTEVDDVNYGIGTAPVLSFLNGSFNGFSYLANFGANGYFSSTGFSIEAGDDSLSTKLVTGTWTNYSVTAVPVPTAFWLFGSGLLGLIQIARRKKAHNR